MGCGFGGGLLSGSARCRFWRKARSTAALAEYPQVVRPSMAPACADYPGEGNSSAATAARGDSESELENRNGGRRLLKRLVRPGVSSLPAVMARLSWLSRFPLSIRIDVRPLGARFFPRKRH
jgi:hypothetical protein